MKGLSSSKILKLYKKGKRDFSNARIHYADFKGENLSGYDFSNCEFFSVTFFDSNLKNCNFTNCEFKWMDFTYANLENSNFSNIKIEWAAMDNTTLKNTNFKKAEFRRISFYDTPINTAQNIDSATFINCFRTRGEITEQDLELMLQKAREAGVSQAALSNIQRVYKKTEREKTIKPGEKQTKEYPTSTDNQGKQKTTDYVKPSLDAGAYKKDKSIGQYKKDDKKEKYEK